MNAAMTTQSAPALEKAFAYLAELEPPGFPQWAGLAQLGKEAALRGDYPAVKRICTACHDRFRARYRRSCAAGHCPRPPTRRAAL